MTSSNYNKVDYLVIETGYTSRILSSKNLLQAFDPEDYGADKECETPRQVLELLKCVYVRDKLWGTQISGDVTPDSDGIFAVASEIEVNNARNVVKKIVFHNDNIVGEYDGIIVFKDTSLSGAFRIAALLKEIEYCAFLDLDTLYSVEMQQIDGMNVLYLFFDTESG